MSAAADRAPAGFILLPAGEIDAALAWSLVSEEAVARLVREVMKHIENQVNEGVKA